MLGLPAAYAIDPEPGEFAFELGSGQAKLRYPTDVAFGPGGIIAVAARGDDRVHVFHPSGALAFQIGSSDWGGPGYFDLIASVAFGPGGIIAAGGH